MVNSDLIMAMICTYPLSIGMENYMISDKGGDMVLVKMTGYPRYRFTR